MPEIYTLDRFEEDFAVMIGDDGEKLDLPRKDFEGRREGDVFERSGSGFVFLDSETKSRRGHNRELMKKLLERSGRN